MSQVLTTWINGLTNDYSKENGIFIQKNNLLTECYTRISTPLGSYPFDETFGSKIPLWLNTRGQIITSDIIVTELLRCTQIILTQKRARTISAKITAPLTKNAIFYRLNIIDNSGIGYQLDNNYVNIPTQVFYG